MFTEQCNWMATTFDERYLFCSRIGQSFRIVDMRKKIRKTSSFEKPAWLISIESLSDWSFQRIGWLWIGAIVSVGLSGAFFQDSMMTGLVCCLTLYPVMFLLFGLPGWIGLSQIWLPFRRRRDWPKMKRWNPRLWSVFVAANIWWASWLTLGLAPWIGCVVFVVRTCL